MKRIAIAFVLFACGACGSPPVAHAPDAPLDIKPLDAAASPKKARYAPAPALDLPTFMASADVQSVTSAHVAAFLNVAALRTMPVAPKLREMVQSKTKMELFDDIDWALWAGPSIQDDEEALVIVAVRPNAEVKWSIERLMREAGHPNLDEVEFDGVHGWRLRGKKLVLRVRDDRVVFVRESKAREAVAAFRKPMSAAPSPGTIIGLYGAREGARLPGIVPGMNQFEELRASVDTRGDGAELFAVGRCADATAASTTADLLNDLIKMANQSGARMATHGILDDARATANGTSTELRVPMSEEQLEFLVQALAAMP